MVTVLFRNCVFFAIGRTLLHGEWCAGVKDSYDIVRFCFKHGAQVHVQRSHIAGGYDFIEKPGERVAFDAMIALAEQGGNDHLFIDTVKELAGNSLADFKAALTAINDAGMTIHSLRERSCTYSDFMTVIEMMEELMPAYQKNWQSIMAVAMCMVEADVFQAVANYKREQEQANT